MHPAAEQLLPKLRADPLNQKYLSSSSGAASRLRQSRGIFIGHLEDPASASSKQPWSWKIVVGANPAYDAFPMQHQIFYPDQDGVGRALV